MTAKEMFEELGYNQVLYQNGNQISYEKDDEEINYFVFNKKEEKIGIGLYFLTPKHLKAIYKQMEELGWIE